MGVVAKTVHTAGQTVGRAATATTMAAGAVGSAAVDGVIGAVKGAANGIRHGADTGSYSTPAAALTLGALGLTGLVQWPVLVVVGGTALAWRQLSRRRSASTPAVHAVPSPATTSTESTNGSTGASTQPSPAPRKAPAKAKPRQTPASRPRAAQSDSES